MKSIKIPLLAAIMIVGLGAAPAPAQNFSTDNQIKSYERLLQRNPRNAQAYFALADAFIRKARENGDAEYFNRAEAALKKSLELAPGNAGALRHVAYVYYSRHEFAPAAAAARDAIARDAGDANAYGILGDALLETGQYELADEAYRKMMTLDQSLYSYSRLAGLKYLRGDVAGSMNDLRLAVAAGKRAQAPAESVAWVQWQLGSDHFGAGDLAGAEIQYGQSLESYPNYYRALAGLAQIRAAQGRYDAAIELYRKAIGIIPMPETIAALGDVYAKIGESDEARKQYELVEFIGKLSALNKALYNRELAYFYADHNVKPAQGLELAKRELDYRKDIYAYDVVAWNLFKNGELAEARAAIDEALKLGTQDAKLFYHGGMIYRRLGDQAKAKSYLRRALSINRHFHIVFAADAARALEELESPAGRVEAGPQQNDGR